MSAQEKRSSRTRQQFFSISKKRWLYHCDSNNLKESQRLVDKVFTDPRADFRAFVLSDKCRRGVMKTRKLGNSDLHITAIGIGAWAIGGSGWYGSMGPHKEADSIPAIHAALDHG